MMKLSPHAVGKTMQEEMQLRDRCAKAAKLTQVHIHVKLTVLKAMEDHDPDLAGQLRQQAALRHVTTCSVLYNYYNRRRR
jgi:hypothetical protein